MSFWSADSGIAVGSEGLILRTINGGDNWNQIGVDVTTLNITGVTCIEEDLIVAIVGNNTVLK